MEAKLKIWSIEKWSKIGFGHVIIIFEKKIEWSKIGFSKQAHHVGMNSFKHFSGAKKGPPRNMPRKNAVLEELQIELFSLKIYSDL